MKILALADLESPYLWDYFDRDFVKDVDLILACGDLDPEYLTFMATLCTAPVCYVHGNHDKKYLKKPPEGCICIDDDLITVKGVRLLGLGGSRMYNDGPFQYTDNQMKRRVFRLALKLRKQKGFDILVTHSPAEGLGDGLDLPHQGFRVFNELMDKYQPALMVHGHMHKNYGYGLKREYRYQNTRVINAYEKYIIEL